MQTKFRDSLDDFPLDDALEPGPSPRPVTGKLPINPDDLVDLFRAAVFALDAGRLSGACEPFRRLRLWGFSITWRPIPRRQDQAQIRRGG